MRVKVVSTAQWAKICSTKPLGRTLLAEGMWCFEWLKSKQTVGRCCGQICDPHGRDIGCRWADGINESINRNSIRLAPSPGATFGVHTLVRYVKHGVELNVSPEGLCCPPVGPREDYITCFCKLQADKAPGKRACCPVFLLTFLILLFYSLLKLTKAKKRTQHLAKKRTKHLAKKRTQHLAKKRTKHLAKKRTQHLAKKRTQHLAKKRTKHLASVRVVLYFCWPLLLYILINFKTLSAQNGQTFKLARATSNLF